MNARFLRHSPAMVITYWNNVRVLVLVRCESVGNIFSNQEGTMRQFVFSAAVVAAIAAGGSLMAVGAQAAPAAPSALQGAAADLNPATEVRTVCRMVRTRFGWRRSCYWVNDRVYAPRYRRPAVRFRF
jgi:hypothetical protein